MATARRRARSPMSATSSTGLIKLVAEPRAIGQVFNLGNNEEISIGALAERVRTATGSSSSEIVCIPYDEAYEAGFEDMPRRVPDLRKIKALVGYEPTLALDEILRRVVAHTRALARAGKSAIIDRSEPFTPRARSAAERLLLANAKPIRRLLSATGRDRAVAAARHRPDREHESLQREVRVLPARRDASPAGRDGHRSLHEDRRRVRGARHHARARAQLRRAVPRSAAGREGPVREVQGHRRSRA